jgi:tetratricopeptide (TPR) repeat protein
MEMARGPTVIVPPTRRDSVRKGATMGASRFAFAVLLAIAPAVAGAVPKAPTEAEMLFGRGVEAFEAGRYEAAAAYLSQAYALEPEARLAFNTALAYERVGKATEAVTWYRLAAESAEAALQAEAEAATASPWCRRGHWGLEQALAIARLPMGARPAVLPL